MKNIQNISFVSLLVIGSTCYAMGDNNTGNTTAGIDEKYEAGKEAHRNHCYKCHDDDIYTREDSFIKSIDALSKQVVRCKDNIGIPWFDEDTETVIHFMNKKFYKF